MERRANELSEEMTNASRGAMKRARESRFGKRARESQFGKSASEGHFGKSVSEGHFGKSASDGQFGRTETVDSTKLASGETMFSANRVLDRPARRNSGLSREERREEERRESEVRVRRESEREKGKRAGGESERRGWWYGHHLTSIPETSMLPMTMRAITPIKNERE
jgi:hypothetical protein